MKRLFLYLSAIVVAVLSFSSCSKDEAYWKVRSSIMIILILSALQVR